MWNVFPAASVVRDAPRDSVSDFLSWAFDHSSREDVLLLCSTLWATWFLRNKEVHTTDRCDLVQLAMSFHKLVADFNQYADKTHIPFYEPLLKFQNWNPPYEGWVKINFDAHVGARSSRGLGVVIRDVVGKLLAAGIRRVRAKWSFDVCEAAAALFGAELVVRLGHRLVQLEGGSLNVVHAIENRVKGSSPIHLIYDDIAFCCSKFVAFGVVLLAAMAIL